MVIAKVDKTPSKYVGVLTERCVLNDSYMHGTHEAFTPNTAASFGRRDISLAGSLRGSSAYPSSSTQWVSLQPKCSLVLRSSCTLHTYRRRTSPFSFMQTSPVVMVVGCHGRWAAVRRTAGKWDSLCASSVPATYDMFLRTYTKRYCHKNVPVIDAVPFFTFQPWEPNRILHFFP